METFNLMSDRWIPVTTIEGKRVISLGSLVDVPGFEVLSIDCHPISRLAIVRLAMAMKAWVDRFQVKGEMPLLLKHRDWFDLKTAFQVPGLPVDSARHPEDIINMSDANGVAWSPLPKKPITPQSVAMALVTAYFCDRGGLKARVPGLPISAQSPLHMGMRVKMKRGETIGELLKNNPVKYDSDYHPPWVAGLTMPDHTEPRDELELLLWPWRRLQVFSNGITIAPGAPIDKATVDPWVLDKAGLKHLDSQPEPDHEITALILNQAMPVACWMH